MTNKKRSIEYLHKLLANTYVLYNKTQNYHWNLKGSSFLSIHKFLEDNYKDYQKAMDEIAETILMLGVGKVNASFSELLRDADIKEGIVDASNQNNVVHDLVQDHEKVLAKLEKDLEDEEIDPIVEDLIIDRVKFHRKVVWMLSATKL